MGETLELVQAPAPTLVVNQTGGIALTVNQAAPVALTVLSPVVGFIELLATSQPSLGVITGGTPGPQGPPGVSAEEEMPYAERTDIVSESLIYRAQAVPGTADSDALWRIRRLTMGADGDVTTQWADGNANFDNTWADRLTLSFA